MGRLRCHAGFTLVELVAVLALVAILLSLAVPAYRQHSLRVHRGEATTALLRQASLLEQHYREQDSYNGLDSLTARSGAYRIEHQVSSDGQSYLLTAIPEGAQARDDCGSLSLDQLGQRRVGETSGRDAASCWSGY